MNRKRSRSGPAVADLRRAVEAGERVPFYLLYGEEEYERDATAAWLSQALAPDAAPDFNIDVFHGDTVVPEDFHKAYDAYPMMAGHRLVLLRACEKLAAAALEALADAVAAPAATTVVIAVGGKVDMRRKFFAQCARQGRAVEFRPPYDNELPQWVQRHSTSQGLKLDAEAADLLRLYVGANLRELAGEIAKLATYAGAEKNITRHAVERVVGLSRSTSIFELTDAIGHRDHPRSLALLHQLIEQGEDHGRTIAMMCRHFRLLLRAQNLLGAVLPRAELASRLGVAPFFLKTYLDQASRYPSEQLWDGLGALLEADSRLKSQSRRQGSGIMDLLLYRLCVGTSGRGVDRG